MTLTGRPQGFGSDSPTGSDRARGSPQLGFGKVGFCEMFAKRGTLQRSGCEVLREGIFENYNIIFLTNCATL